MEQQIEKEHSRWGVQEEEEMEEATLEGRKSSQHHFKDDEMNTSVAAGTTSPSPPAIQKENGVAERDNITSERKHHCTDEEVKDTATRVDAITRTTRIDVLQNGDVASFDNREDIQNTPFNGVNNQCIMKTVEDEDPLDSQSSNLQNLSELNGATVQHLDDETSPKVDPELIEDFDQRLRELDVEAVLATQETHDLFCPNCKSCITKRVILKKRKRRVQDLDPNAKHDKFDTVVNSNLVDGSANEANQSDEAITTNIDREVPPADSNSHEREPEAFRCLSCFRYFIPTGNGFSLFHKIFGTHQQESSHNSSSLPAFDSQGSSRLPMTDEKNLSNDMIPKHVRDLSVTTITSEAVVKAEEHAEDPAAKPYEEEAENSEKDIYKKSTIATEDKLNVQNSYDPSSMPGSQVPAQSFFSAEPAKNATSGTQSGGGDAEYLPEQDLKLVEKVKTEIEDRNPLVGTENKGSEVILVVEPVESTTIQTEDSVPIEGTTLTETSTQAQAQAHNVEQAGDEVGEPYGWEILKSIVYGGLIESIASLGIVTSAVSAGASSLNIIALGLANLVGGLFIIVHHLMELKEDDDSGGDTQQTNRQEDRYQRLLGRRENFVLHAVVSVLSFLIFGAVPVVIYGILIGENYPSEVKIAVVAASLVCIILLAIVKVYTKNPPRSYVKTLSYCVTLAVATSGVSYVMGQLIKDLIEKLSELVSGCASIAMPIAGSAERELPWTSY